MLWLLLILTQNQSDWWWASLFQAVDKCSLKNFQNLFYGNGTPLQYSCLENPRDGGAWWAAVYGVAQSQTRLKRLSSSSSMPGLTNTGSILVAVNILKLLSGTLFPHVTQQ